MILSKHESVIDGKIFQQQVEKITEALISIQKLIAPLFEINVSDDQIILDRVVFPAADYHAELPVPEVERSDSFALAAG